jgi:hypothetical protein
MWYLITVGLKQTYNLMLFVTHHITKIETNDT